MTLVYYLPVRGKENCKHRLTDVEMKKNGAVLRFEMCFCVLRVN